MYIGDEGLKPKRNKISFSCETRLCFRVIHLHPRVLLMKDSFFLLIPGVLFCKSLFYRKIFSHMDRNIPIGYQESPKLCSDIYVRVFMMVVASQRYTLSVLEDCGWTEVASLNH